jgi:DNA-binding CsgD family transcriptional regulator
VTNEMRPSRRLVVGPGGTGRTHLLRSWADEFEADGGGLVIGLTGHHARPVKAESVIEALAADPAALVLDDLQWFDDGALAAVLDGLESSKSKEMSVWGSRRTWPTSSRLQAVSDLLTEDEGATRTGLLADEEFAQIASSFIEGTSSTKALDELRVATAGSLGLAADAVAAGWERDLANLPPQLVEAVANRITRCGPEATALVQLLAFAPSLEVSELVDALDEAVDQGRAERAVRAGGLLDDAGVILPIVRAAVTADLPAATRARIHDRLAAALIHNHPEHAAESVMAGRGEASGSEEVLIAVARGLQRSDPARALDMADHGLACGFDRTELTLIRLRAAYEQGSPEVLGYLDEVPVEAQARAAALGFGLDMRDLRWQSAASRPLGEEISVPLTELALMLSGEMMVSPGEPAETGANARLVSSLVSNMALLAAGDSRRAIAGLAEAADDYDRVDPDIPLGITPHAVGASAAVTIGDLATSQALLDQAITARSGGEGEEVTHRLLRAYTRLAGGRFDEALAAVREGEGTGWALRDRFLLAAIDAAIARRSGDTTRLRDAWSRADPVLVRTSASWLFADLVVELLAAGSRLGETSRVEPVADELAFQLLGLPSSGPGEVSAHWLRLQIALASGDKPAIATACDALQKCTSADDRSVARIHAGAAWAAIQSHAVDDEVLTAASQSLESVGDGWEASRLLGQAALDHPDPVIARRLLEEARALAVEPEAAGETGLVALGLSEREAEVAVLVAAGRTYKEVGAQLYVSPKTVEHHVARIRRKIGANSRAEFLAAIKAATASEA